MATPLVDPLASFAGAAGSDRLKVCLIGCGGRGTAAAMQAISADPGAVLWSLADPFPDVERRFAGLDGYKLIDACDVVLLTAPPDFRPPHLRAAAEAGRQVFAEKPMAVDAAGLRSVRDSVKIASDKKLSLVSEFCWRYSERMRAWRSRSTTASS